MTEQDLLIKASWPGRQDLKKEDLKNLFQQMSKEKINDAIFFDGPLTEIEFTIFANNIENHFAVIYSNSAQNNYPPLALFWLNRHSGQAAMLHFAIFKRALGQKKILGNMVLNWCFAGGLTTLISLTPSYNQGAIAFGLSLGGKILGRLKKALYSQRSQKAIDGTLLLFEQDS